MPYFHKQWVPAPNTLQLEMVFGTWGGMAENVYHIHGTGTITDLGLLANKVADAAIAWDAASIAPLRSNAYALRVVRVRDIGEPDGFAIERSLAQSGGRNSPACPDNVTVAMKWVTGRAGRSYRGRTFHVGMTNDMTDQDVLVPAVATGMQTAYNALVGRMSGLDVLNTGIASAALSVVSISHNHAPRSTAEVTAITNAVLSDTNIDSQRRRLRGRGK